MMNSEQGNYRATVQWCPRCAGRVEIASGVTTENGYTVRIGVCANARCGQIWQVDDWNGDEDLTDKDQLAIQMTQLRRGVIATTRDALLSAHLSYMAQV